MDNLILVWIFSCVLAWALTGSATSMGETMTPDAFRMFLRLLGFIVSVIAIATTPALAPAFTTAFSVAGFHSATAMAGVSFILWSFVHLSGAVFTVFSTGYKLATCRI